VHIDIRLLDGRMSQHVFDSGNRPATIHLQPPSFFTTIACSGKRGTIVLKLEKSKICQWDNVSLTEL
jgi:hypothetical protein